MKKVFALLLVLCLSVGMLACGTKTDSGETSKDDTTTTTTDDKKDDVGEDAAGEKELADFSEHLEISLWVHTMDNEDGYMADVNENPVIAYLSEKFNVTFEWQLPPTGSEAEQMSLMIGSGDYTDVFDTTFSQQTCVQLYEDGVIQNLAPYAEDYLPNYLAYVASNENAGKSAYLDGGEIVYIPNVYDTGSLEWGGMMYNHQILVDMTEDNVQFPSGNENPTTVEDWEYILNLTYQYYQASGLTDYACLIIPASGYFLTGDILAGFGTAGDVYIDDNGQAQHGMLQDGFYNYLVKMKEWYDKGWLYQDFASRSSDPFYFPNTALTWSGGASIFYGLEMQLSTRMSMPDYGLFVDYRAITAPLDTEHGVTEPLAVNSMVASNKEVGNYSGGWVVSESCDEDKLIRWLQICDYLFTEEGSMMKSYGLTKDQAGDNAIYAKLGMQDGAYWFDENGEFTYNPVSDPFNAEATVKENQLRAQRLPGLENKTYRNSKADEIIRTADAIWTQNGYENAMPVGSSFTTEETEEYAPLATAVSDYVNSMIPKFIMGTEELNEESWETFKETARSLGIDRILELSQIRYDRHMNK